MRPEKIAILNQVEFLKEDLVKLVSDLVKIPSVNPTYAGVDYHEALGGETRVNEHLKLIMDRMGLETAFVEHERGRSNLVGSIHGSGGGKSLIFNGHVDVVPPGDSDNWKSADPWGGEIKDGKVWGRGSCDMKGGDAAAMIALKAVLQAGYMPKGDIHLEFVCGEENQNTDAGVGAVIGAGYHADAAIVVEPSGAPYRLAIATASPSASHFKLTVRGLPTHSCNRDQLIRAGGLGAKCGVSSIDKTYILYQGLLKLEERWGQTKLHPVFMPGHFSISPGATFGGKNGVFVISDYSTLEYAVYASPYDSFEVIRNEIEDEIALICSSDPWLREHPPEIEWNSYWPPYDVSKEEPICKVLHSVYEEVIGAPPRYSGFCTVSDATFLNQAGIPTVLIGPGSIWVGHSPDEYVPIDELMDAAKIYACAIVDWCGVSMR